MSSYLHFDDMTWPNPDDPNEVEWRLRHTPGYVGSDAKVAASYIAAYKQLVNDPQRVRNAKVAAIRLAAEQARANQAERNQTS